MQVVNVATFDEDHDYLQMHQEEFAALFDTILINVTPFFRDPDVWDYLRAEVLPGLPAVKSGEPIRIWSAGCASGEEPYSIATERCDWSGSGSSTTHGCAGFFAMPEQRSAAGGRRGVTQSQPEF